MIINLWRDTPKQARTRVVENARTEQKSPKQNNGDVDVGFRVVKRQPTTPADTQ
jgi:hypothetical protein